MTTFVDTLTGQHYDLDERRSKIIEQAVVTMNPPEIAARLTIDIEQSFDQATAASISTPTGQ